MKRSRWDCLSHWSSFRDGSHSTSENPGKAVHDWSECLKLLTAFGIGLASLLSKAWQAFNPWQNHLLDKFEMQNWIMIKYIGCFGSPCMSLTSTAFFLLLAVARSWVMLLYFAELNLLALDLIDISCWARFSSCLWSTHACHSMIISLYAWMFHVHPLHSIHCIACFEGE